jgi:hypothetical protein
MLVCMFVYYASALIILVFLLLFLVLFILSLV